MNNIIEQYKTVYDGERKIWKDPVLKPFYDRNCSFGYIAFEELRRRPSLICQISDSENTCLTNEEVRMQAIRIARSFEKFGIQQSDIIGIAGRNTTYVFSVVLACFFNGSAYHAINPNYDKNISKLLFDITKPKLIFCDGQDLEKIRYASSDFGTEIFTLKNHQKGVSNVMELLKPTGDEHKYQAAELKKGTSQNMAILCSSGSTGMPKAVTISHLHRMWDLTNFLTEDDIQYMASTMDWLSSLLSLVSSIVYGAARVISDKPSTPELFLDIAQKYKITFTIQSPPAMAALTKCPQATPEKLESIRYFIYGGSISTLSSQETMQKLLRNGRIVNAYGLTELNTALCRNFNFVKKPNSIGILLPGMEARIVDDNGENLGPNKSGELLCRNGIKWSGYYNNVVATKEIYDDDGWIHTGDLGYFDDDNYLYIVDRKKELLKYKNIQYYPNQIEEVISQIPDVKEVCVFGIFSDLYGDIAAAAVVKVEGSPLTPEDVVSYVRQHVEVEYMQLHGGCKMLQVISKTPNGKTDRKATKEVFLKIPAELKKGTNQNLAILCSSGSSGTPKAVTISHLHRLWELTNFLTEDDIQYMYSTMDWLSALMNLVNSIVYGAPRVISDKPSTPEYFLEIAQKYKITYTIQSPPAMAALTKCPQATPEKLESIRYFIYGGSISTLSSQEAMQKLLRNGRIINSYGLTELNTALCKNFNFVEKPNSSGILLPGMEVRIVDGNGENLGPNKSGELLCRNDIKWSGYFNNVVATKYIYDKDGWIHTGDLGYFDVDGYLYIVDRKKDLLKYKGMQYYPHQIEEVISQMTDVKEVCVFGIFSELHGDIAAAAVVKVEGSTLIPEDVVSYVRQHVEVDYMQLHGGCKMLQVISKTPNGKINRKATKEVFLKM